MKRFYTLILCLIFAGVCFSQTKIEIGEAGTHVGDSVTVCGKVSGGRFLDQVKDSPTLINLGAPYPNQLLTLVIWKEARSNFETAPEVLLKDKNVCVTGKIELYKDKPQIIIRKKEQIVIQP